MQRVDYPKFSEPTPDDIDFLQMGVVRKAQSLQSPLLEDIAKDHDLLRLLSRRLQDEHAIPLLANYASDNKAGDENGDWSKVKNEVCLLRRGYQYIS